MVRQLASIQKILSLNPIVDADSIECATVLGWQCVVRKGVHTVGELILYLEVDSIVPDLSAFHFLKSKDCKNDKWRRLKTARFRGQISQGLVMPLSCLDGCRYNTDTREHPIYTFKEDKDVTELLGVTKYEPPLPAHLGGEAKGLFPSFLTKTDETRVQVLQSQLTKYKGVLCNVTEKLDGASITCYVNDGVFGVCSRNLDLKLDGQNIVSNAFVKMALALGIESKLRSLNMNIAIQGELVGSGIQNNRLKLPDRHVYWFSAYNITTGKYYGVVEFQELCRKLELDEVPLIDMEYILSDDIPTLVEMAKDQSALNTDCLREGIVIRPIAYMEDYSEGVFQAGRVSFKVINPEYLIKHNE